MGVSPKLQGEINRVLKKVQEGTDLFDSIWNEYEAESNEEIKKLQRYRDQIKAWIQSSEIKDKKALLDACKQIEHEIERFKICEKETKTKAFSKEALGQQPKSDPREKAKSETRDWINNVVRELESQIDAFEVALEGLTVKTGKKRPHIFMQLEAVITHHKDHIMKLELFLRQLDNDELSPERVNVVKDVMDRHVEVSRALVNHCTSETSESVATSRAVSRTEEAVVLVTKLTEEGLLVNHCTAETSESVATSRAVSRTEEAVVLVTKLTEEGLLVESSRLYMYAMYFITSEAQRDVFLAMPKNGVRLGYLRFMYEKEYGVPYEGPEDALPTPA